ncbi:hypothetical protein C479_12112 [Halovivax asiaticus JCM 14624]|uniref:Uncharacterized protein n=1 Tax=Halovivax asiaticus JCM 14624 TaxID=1227490 RepID=M0BE75_9EURY|nr:hypothetical protein [Halovivax asiaticus]ELZ09130.1 hypothetical protein C479_12112 [Halovivax asiaticus JCM 14624]
MLEAAVSDVLDEDWADRTTVGWFLALPFVAAIGIWAIFDHQLSVPIGTVGLLLLIGYGRHVVLGSVVDPELPAVGDIGGLATSVLVGGAVVIGLVGVPTGLAALALWADVSPIATAVTELTAATVVAVVFLTGAYLTPAVLAVSGRRLRVADSPAGDRRVSRTGALVAIVSSRDYAVATLQAILALFAIGAATLMLIVTVFGLAVLPAVVYLAVAVSARRYGYAVDRVLDPRAVDELEDRTVSWL